MKKLLLVISLAFVAPVVVTTSGCATTPTTQNVQVQSLLAVGHTAESVVALAAQLYQSKHITADQARKVNEFYDTRFQPVYRLAVATSKADLSTIASPDVLSLAVELSALLTSFTQKPTP